MATHSSVLAWRIPGTGEPGGLPDVYGVAQSRTRLKRLSNSSIPSYAILVAVGNDTVSFVSLSDFLLCYKYAKDFYVLILYPWLY